MKMKKSEIPENLTVMRNTYGAMVETFSGRAWLDLSMINENVPLTDDEMLRLEALVRAANRSTELEALAREMANDLNNWRRSHGEHPITSPLVDRARALGLLTEEAPHAD